MKKELDKKGRILYKFSSSVSQGGYLYAHKTYSGDIIKNKEGLRNVLYAIANKFELIDVTIKIYDSIFFFFFMMKPSILPIDIINTIQKNIAVFGLWDQDYLYTGVYDLQKEYLIKDLEKWGYDYDKG